MFRALLWKEWRELWILPVMAVPLAGISVFFTSSYNRLDPAVWEIAFGLWLTIAAIYIASHLYAREKETGAAKFLYSRPLDKFRLWWIRLLIGFSILIILTILLFCTVQSMSHFYLKPPSYESQKNAIIWDNLSFALLCFCVSVFFSAFSKKQLTVILSSIVAPALFSFIQTLAMDRGLQSGATMDFPDDKYYVPILLFAALVIFARRSLWRSTRLSLWLTYTTLAILAFAPLAAHFIQAPLIQKNLEKGLMPYAISEDGRFVLIISDGGKSYLLDTNSDSVRTLDKKFESYRVALNGNQQKMLVWETPKFSPSSLTLIDMSGQHEKDIYTGRWFEQFPDVPLTRWSYDRKYLGLTKNASWQFRGWVAITDADGNQLAKYMFPILEMVQLWPIGWDSQERFYFRKTNGRGTSYWRISLHDAAPERVFIPEKILHENDWFRDIYGDWMDCSTYSNSKWNYLFYNLATAAILSLKNADSVRIARDGSMLAYLQEIPGNDDEASTAYRLVVQAPPGEEAFSVNLPPGFVYIFRGFSQSNRYILLSQLKQERRKETPEFRVLSLATWEFTDVAEPASSIVYWTANDHLLWSTGTSLIVTDIDGSNPKELVGLKGDKVISASRRTK